MQRDARRLLADVYGQAVTGEIRVTISDAAGHRVTVVFPADDPRQHTPMAQAVLEALSKATGPLSAPQLARQAGYPCNSRFRGTLTALDREGLIRRTPDGYVQVST